MAVAPLPHSVGVAGQSGRCVLSIDLEDWFHLAYLERERCDRTHTVIDALDPFLDGLRQRGVRTTLFVVATVAQRHAGLLRRWAKEGHEVGVHGWDHEILRERSAPEFLAECRRARALIENTTGVRTWGFRAPCFRLRDEQLQLLAQLGFRYDSSKAGWGPRGRRAPRLRGFSRLSELVYVREGFYELSLPTAHTPGVTASISGGGFLRLTPAPVLERLLSRFLSGGHSEMAVYVHPFELCEREIPLPSTTSRLSRWRFSVGRKGNGAKVLALVDAVRTAGFEFVTCGELIEHARGEPWRASS